MWQLAKSLCVTFIASTLTVTSAWAIRLEAGTGSTPNTATTSNYATITFQEEFDVIPIVVPLTTSEGSDPADLRIRNVTTTGFEIAAREPSGEDGIHPGMNFQYIAMEPGQFTLPDGTDIAAGFHSTSAQQRGNGVGVPATWDNVNFGTTLSSTGSVLAAIQTENSEQNSGANQVSVPFMSLALRNPNTASFQVALERSEVTPGNANVVAESIGWIAFPRGVQGNFADNMGNTIFWDARATANIVRGWDNGCFTSTFAAAASWANPIVIAARGSRFGGDGGWVRRCSLGATTIGLQVDEDQFQNAERRHITEIMSLLSFSDSFHTSFKPVLNAKKSASTAAGQYSLPGSLVRYTIKTENAGNGSVDTDTMIITDKIPDNVDLVVSDLGATGSGPVIFTDGSPTSSLSYTFSSLTSLVDDVDFSDNNGITFDYVPIAGGNGADPNVTHIRIHPKGGFAAAMIGGSPNFTVEFDVAIK